ncbi:MAG: inorganic phosphate transporter [Bacteroidaceae bacterium]
METIYLGIIIFLFMLAVFDLSVGVSNDAVNFLNSAIGAKVAGLKTIMVVAAIGIFCGATMSNGMMDIARHGIFQPEQFCFHELMCLFLAVMVTDVVLLDVFNTLGLPTSTTVSLVFELLGGTFLLALLKIAGSDGTLGFADLLNTEKALSVILGIFLSVAIAFIFGTVVQYIARLIFTFNYTKRLKYSIGIFGGIAVTAIVYFMLLKRLKGSPVVPQEALDWVDMHMGTLVLACFLFFTLLMQILYWCKVNVFKIIVLLGTFALAMAFAGNDLVNFIGVPLAGLSSFQDFMANGNPRTFLMSSLNESAKTPFIFLFLAGVVMIIAMTTSRKAQNVIKTSVDLARQSEGEEMFGTSAVARSLVRAGTNTGSFIAQYMPKKLSRWIDSRFNQDVMIIKPGAAFDLVRASVNLVLAGLLIAAGTSMKLPLSTTYVTFIVAMGTSLADRAWSRESAVFRITGVLSVIGGWFITAGAAFFFCFLITLIMYFGGFPAMIIMIVVAVVALMKSNVLFQKRKKSDGVDEVFLRLANTQDKNEVFSLLRTHYTNTLSNSVDFALNNYTLMTDAFIGEDLKRLRKASSQLDDARELLKKNRRKEIIGLRRIDRNLAIEKNTWFHLGINSCEQMLYCLKRICEPCKEHVDNHFNPLPKQCVEEFLPLRNELTNLMERARDILSHENYDEADKVLTEGDALKEKFSALRKLQMNRIQEEEGYENVSLVYLNLLQESQELVSVWRHLLRAGRNFR